MKVKILGKQLIHSKKSGKDYTVIHYESPLNFPNSEGARSEALWLDPVVYPLNTFKVGTFLNVDFDGRGYPVNVTQA